MSFCKPSPLLLKLAVLWLVSQLGFVFGLLNAGFVTVALRQVICSHAVGLMTRDLVETQLQVMALDGRSHLLEPALITMTLGSRAPSARESTLSSLKTQFVVGLTEVLQESGLRLLDFLVLQEQN